MSTAALPGGSNRCAQDSREVGLGIARFVGRDAERARLAAALDQPGFLVLIEGEGGIGKSRLVAECLADRAPTSRDGAVVLAATCPPFSQPFTLGPIVGAVRHAVSDPRALRLPPVAGALRPLLPDWDGALPEAPVALPSPREEHHRLFEALAAVLAALESSVLVVEDLHWADEATLNFLLFLLAERPVRPVLVVTYRREDLRPDSLVTRISSYAASRPNADHLTLGALEPDAVVALASSMLGGGPIDGKLAALLRHRTDGVPLLLQELIRLMLERGDLEWTGASWIASEGAGVHVPSTIRDFVLERFSRLGPPAQAVTQAEAVLSEPADLQTLAYVTALDETIAGSGVDEAIRSGLLCDAGRGRVRFGHVLAERSVYDDLPPSQRSVLHLRAGDHLERSPAPSLVRLARHFREAGDLRRWSGYGEQAANLALEMGDDATAIEILQDLVGEELLDVASRVRMAQHLGTAAISRRSERGTDLGTISDLLESVSVLPGIADEPRAVIEDRLARLLFQDGRPGAARIHVLRALSHQSADPTEAARAMGYLGWPQSGPWPLDVHLHWLRRAAEMATLAPPRDRLFLQVDQLTALLLLGREEGWRLAAELPESAGSSTERLQIARGLQNSGHCAILWGRDADARNRIGRALDWAETERSTRLKVIAGCSMAHLDWCSGELTGLASRAADLATDPDLEPSNRAEIEQVILLLRTVRGEVIDAESELQDALSEVGELTPTDLSFALVAMLAQLQADTNQRESALATSTRAIEAIRQKGVWLWSAAVLPVHVDTLVRLGRIEEAEDLLADVVRGVAGSDAPALEAALRYARGGVASGRGDHGLAVTEYDAATAAWQAMPRRREAFLAMARGARVRELLGRVQEASARARRAKDGLERLGCAIDVRRLGQLGAPLAPVRSPAVESPDPVALLTPRESRAVALVTTGRTDRQIARAMGVSVNTVITHLASARRKLDVRSRTELAVLALELGLVLHSDDPPSSSAKHS